MGIHSFIFRPLTMIATAWDWWSGLTHQFPIPSWLSRSGICVHSMCAFAADWTLCSSCHLGCAPPFRSNIQYQKGCRGDATQPGGVWDSQYGAQKLPAPMGLTKLRSCLCRFPRLDVHPASAARQPAPLQPEQAQHLSLAIAFHVLRFNLYPG